MADETLEIDSYIYDELELDSTLSRSVSLESDGFKYSILLYSKLEENVVKIGSAELELVDE